MKFGNSLSRRVLAVGILMGTIGGLLTALPTQASAPKRSFDLPPLPGAAPAPIPEPQALGPTDPKPGVQPDRSRGSDAGTEDVSGRTAYSTVLDYANGSHRLEISSSPVHYLDGGRWKRIDNHFVTDPAHPSGFMNTANAWTARFANLSAGIEVVTDHQTLRFRPNDAADVAPVISQSGNFITYPDAWPGIDLRYRMRSNQLEEEIIYRRRAEQSAFSFTVLGATFTPDDANTGGLIAVPVTSTGGVSPDLRIEPPVVFGSDKVIRPEASPALATAADPSAPQAGGPSGEDGAVQGGSELLEISVDAGWLASQPDSAYPLTIDPTINNEAADSYQAYSSAVPQTTCGCTQTGNAFPSGNPNLYWRSLAHFPYQSLVTNHALVFDAELTLNLISGTAEESGLWVYEANGGTYNGQGQGPVANGPFDDFALVGGGGLASLYQGWINGNYAGGSLFLEGQQDAGRNTFKRFDVTLSLDYDSLPSTPLYVGPASGATVTTYTPTLAISPVSDADGDVPQIRFDVSSDASGANQVWTSGWQASRSVAVPAGVLHDGASYYWSASTLDVEGLSSPGAVRSFRLNRRVGGDATQTEDAFGPVTIDLANGNLRTSVSTPSVATVAGNAGVSLTYNSLSTTAVGSTLPPAIGFGLPDGWTLAAGDDGSSYVQARIEPNSVVLVEPSGSTHEYAKTATGGFTSPAGEGSFLTKTPSGAALVLQDDDGKTYSFSASDGRLTNVTDPVDDRKPAALTYSYSGSPLRLASISDPGRPDGVGNATNVVSLSYNRSGDTCPSRAEFGPAPANMLCAVRLIDGRQTEFHYANGLLSRVIQDSTSTEQDEVLGDYGYNTTGITGLMNRVRTSAGYDLDVANGYGIGGTSTFMSYLGTKVSTVQLPQANGTSGARPRHDYTYRTGIDSTGFYAGNSGFTGGADVAVGNVVGDSAGDQIISGAGANEDGFVRVFNRDGSLPSPNPAFTPYNTGFAGAINVAAGDIDADGRDDVVVGATQNGGPRVLAYRWTGSGWTTLVDFVAYETNFVGGVDVGAGDIDGDGKAEIITAPGPGRAGDVRVWRVSGGSATQLTQYSPFADSLWQGGLRVTTIDTDFDGKVEVAAGAMNGGGPRVQVFKPLTAEKIRDFFPLDPGFTGGVDVGGWRGSDQLSVTTLTADSALVTTDDGSYVRTPYGTPFNGGTHVAMGDLQRLGVPETATAAAAAGPHIRVFTPRLTSDVADLTLSPQPTAKYIGRIAYDGALRTVESRDSAGLATRTRWHLVKDQVVAVTDPAGLRSTTVYDRHDWPVTQYGPAPGSFFAADGTLLAGHSASDTPTATTGYDIGLKGLAAAFWPNTNLTGAPTSHAFGVGTGDGSVNANWSASNKPPGLDNNNFSLRLTGEIHLHGSGQHTFTALVDDGARLFVNGQKVFEDWTVGGPKFISGTYTNSSGDTYVPIVLEYFQASTGAGLVFYVTAPSQAQQIVPGSDLSPTYGLAMVSTDPDQNQTTTEFASPELGLPTATVVDDIPGGLRLRSTTTYEPIGDGFARRTSKVLPKGAATAVAYSYYGMNGDSNVATDPCTGTTGMKQGSLLKFESNPAPTAGPAIVHEFRYDAAGRQVATRVVGDANWTCTVFDGRGRVKSQTDSANKTTTISYPDALTFTTTFDDTAGATRSTTQTVDLNGNVTSTGTNSAPPRGPRMTPHNA